ncbi:MAG: hypothetical protein NWS04_04590 [Candidatus Nanopelagicales bacterium]|nr:hypothetical protein [Candidatus Nanopelagicales bacterium]MDP4715110.1 hypothetical protein [Candidatus Nanopelagicales bacterium]
MGSVARVIVDVSLPHLDRLFDYSIPDAMSSQVVVGSRVRVRFSGRLVNAFVVDVTDTSEHRLQPIQRVTTDYAVLTPDVLELCRAVADRYAGSLSDVVRAAVPPRHARAETSVMASETEPVDLAGLAESSPLSTWSDYAGGESLLRRMADGERGLRTVLTCAPGAASDPAGDWPSLLADVTAVSAAHGGVILVVPDARDLARVDVALASALGADAYAVLSADLGPQRRYAQFLRILTGRVRVVLGTRAAVFAPVVDPALLIIWDDGDESFAEPHAPGWHAREVLALRSHISGAALLVGGYTRSVEAQAWVASGWAAALSPTRDVIRRVAPRVIADSPADSAARIPRRAYESARDALSDGPVLIQVARRGYVPTLACQQCRMLAACPACGGPLALGSDAAVPTCRWCSTRVVPWRCRSCGSDRLRALAVGSGRTAEELGRAFPGIPVITSTADRSIATMGPEPALVVATTGTEPWAEGGYAAVVILDAGVQVSRVALRAGEETARRWFTAAALARSGAPVVITADAGHPIVQALIRWDPAWLASRELEERRELRLPPIVRSATITGDPAVLEGVAAGLPSQARVIGPLPAVDGEHTRLLITIDRRHGPDLTQALHAMMAVRSARKDPDRLQVTVDPPDWGGD